MATTDAPTPRRILIVTATFPPDGAVGSLRTVRLLKHLAGTRTEVEVLTLAPESYRAGTVIDSERLSQVPPAVRVTHAPALRPFVRLAEAVRGARRPSSPRAGGRSATSPGRKAGSSAGILRRARRAVSALLTLPDPEVSWIVPAILRGARRAKSDRPDVILSSGPPFSAHLVGGVLAAVTKSPWVADFRDPWARAPWRDDRFGFERRAWSILERSIATRADAVLFVTRANRDDFAAQYGQATAARFHVVPNGCDTADFEGLVPAPPSDRFVLLHAGSLYGARNPSPLFRAVAKGVENGAIDPGRFTIRLIGRVGIPGVDLADFVRELGLQQVVEFVPHMPRAQVLQQMVDASALLVVQPVTKLSVPGKLYEYLATGRPILALAEPDGETAMLLRRTPAGVVVSPDDHDGILRAVTQLITGGRRRFESDPSLYDGALRAAEMARTLRLVMTPSDDRPTVNVVPVSTKRS